MVSDSAGLMDFAIGLVNSVLHLPSRQVDLLEGEWGNSNYRRTSINPALQKIFLARLWKWLFG